jgi:peptidoglycan/xylan/chitin deacetylase (PgdA/CDA1 family)
MITIIPPFSSINRQLSVKHLLENNLEMKFSFKQKVYYNYLRSVIPISVRKKFQEKYGADVKYKKNFIDSTLVDYVFENETNKSSFENLYPGKAKFAVILTHDVETESGLKAVPQIIQLEAKYGFNSSWNLIPYKYKIDEAILDLIRETNNEIGIHGYNHDGRLYFSKKIFMERAKYINEALKKFGAVGFRSPMVHRNLEWLQELDINYDCSCFDYDPFQPFPGGTGSIWPFIAGKFVELPYTMPQDHTLFYVLKEKTIDIWRKKADWLVSRNGVILVLTHPDYLSEGSNIKMYEELLIYLSSLKNGYRPLPRELAGWWSSKHSGQYQGDS